MKLGKHISISTYDFGFAKGIDIYVKGYGFRVEVGKEGWAGSHNFSLENGVAYCALSKWYVLVQCPRELWNRIQN
jgi:hypothetical protein